MSSPANSALKDREETHGQDAHATRVAILLLGVLAAAQCALAGPDKLLLAGNDQGLWLVRNTQDNGQDIFDVLAMKPGGKWQLVAGSLLGSARACAASDRWLHVLQEKSGYLVFGMPASWTQGGSVESPTAGPMADDPHWPRDAIPVAACGADSFYSTAGAAQDSSTTCPPAPAASPLAPATAPAKTTAPASATAPYQTIIVIVEHAALPSTQPATMPARHGDGAANARMDAAPVEATRLLGRLSRDVHWPRFEAPRTGPAPDLAGGPDQPIAHSIFVNLGDKWQYLTDMEALPHGQEMQCAVFGCKLYVMLSSRFGPPRMLAWDKQAWHDVDLPPEINELDGAAAIAMAKISDRLVAVLSSPVAATGPAQAGQHGSIQLLISSAAGDFELPPQPLTLAGRPMPPFDTQPLAARLGSRVAILWGHDNAFNFGTCGLDCAIPSIATVDVLAAARQQDDGQKLIRNFTIAIMAVIFIPLLFFRVKAPPRLFSLPQGVVAGNLVKRGLAAVIDFGPFAVVSLIVFGVHIDELTLLSQQDSNPPLNVVYACIGTLSAYISYCAIMEALWGATLGKMIFGLKVVCDMGAKVTIREAVIRNAIKAIELLPPFMLLLLVMLLNAHRRRFGDLVAKTAVVEARSLPPAVPPADAATGDQQDQAAQEQDTNAKSD